MTCTDGSAQPTCELGEGVCSQSVAWDLLFQQAYDFYFRQVPSTAYIYNTTKLGIIIVSLQHYLLWA
jgi:hypothetical protein